MKNIIKMTTVLILMLASVFLIARVARAADGDIIKAEIQPDGVKWMLDTDKDLRFTKTISVIYRKVDANEKPIGKEIKTLFRDVPDNPDTPEDETLTEYTDFKNFIETRVRAGDSRDTAIKKAVKIKRNIP